ncbi:hypothetical protein T492DRAFT_834896 [Pavlovales sp. CCMP2436]|nr:hypothetical protein T492DRAFT_834896 [Pavlovales sp. CCMP2436]
MADAARPPGDGGGLAAAPLSRRLEPAQVPGRGNNTHTHPNPHPIIHAHTRIQPSHFSITQHPPLADSNRLKFLAEDMELFDGIISDLFPGAELPAPDYGELLPAIEVFICLVCTRF